MDSTVMWVIVLCGLLAIVYAGLTARALMAADAGTVRMREIAAAIQEGAQAYLTRQYTTIAVVGVVIFVIVGLLLGWLVALGFLIGAVLSGAAGYAGMRV
jgi:K(+)-stimulated pyrophosphate-energized sodium pump